MNEAQWDTSVVAVKPTFTWQDLYNSPAMRMARRFVSNYLAVIGLIVLLTLLGVAAFAPYIAPYDPNAVNLQRINQPPTLENVLGTDGVGRDNLSRIIYGARVSLTVGVFSVSLYVLIGVILGTVSGYFGGRVDDFIMRFTEVIMCFPTFPLLLILVNLLGANVINIVLVIGIFGWTGIARLVRGQVLQLRTLDYIIAARSIGCSEATIMFRHMLPNLLGPLLVAATLGIGGAILAEAGLSFLGLGIVRPTPSWGSMLSEARSPAVLVSQTWQWLAPGIAISLSVLAVNFIGDGLRDALGSRNSLRV